MLSYPSGMTVSNRALITLADALRRHRTQLGTRWRRLQRRPPGPAGAGPPAQGRDLRRSGLRVRDRHHHGVPLPPRGARRRSPRWPRPCEQAIEVARRKAFVILDGTLLRIDRVGMAGGRDRPYYSGQTQVPRGERAGHRRPGRPADLGLTRAARRPARHGRRPRARHPRRPDRRRGAGGGRHRLPGRRPDGSGAAATPPARPRHRPLPPAVAQPEGRSTPPTPASADRASGPTPS